ncbi:hypothetical protein E2C01_024306 [Portunus trituberculatus]|uniref:Uncharacterized protein n=1 Tax=Portunus trituberculatus TaxID=210409 RepID=A0A5B7E9Z2_PORTR|nr:hypothetical protein [Portunus trituberculatus]
MGEIEPRVAEELCRLFPKDEGINLTPVLHKSKRASRVARARGPLRRPLQSPGDRRGRPRERGSFRGRGDVGFSGSKQIRTYSGSNSAVMRTYYLFRGGGVPQPLLLNLPDTKQLMAAK